MFDKLRKLWRKSPAPKPAEPVVLGKARIAGVRATETKTGEEVTLGEALRAVLDDPSNVGDIVSDFDGSPIDKSDAVAMYETFNSPKMKFELAPGVEEQLAEAGVTPDQIKDMLIAAARKAALSS